MSWVAAVEIGASDAALWLGMFATAVAIVGSVAAITVKVFRYIDGHQDAYEWVRSQMAENGQSVSAGTVGKTQRDILDDITSSLTVLTADGRVWHQEIVTLRASIERLEVNQREQGQKLAAAMRSGNDHLAWADEKVQAFAARLAALEAAEGEGEP